MSNDANNPELSGARIPGHAVVSDDAGKAAGPAAVSLRPAYHLTVPEQWLNDPQRAIYVNGSFSLYYLYSTTYYLPGEWRRVQSKDCVSFEDKGIAIPLDGDFAAWSGSAVVDTGDTAGFGAGTVIALVTQPTDGDGHRQEQYLWYSHDGGASFEPYGKPVIPNTTASDWFRDPKVAWDAKEGRWIAAIGCKHAVAFYESHNLKDWRELPPFTYEGQNIGGAECPDLFEMRADDGTSHWVLGISVQGTLAGKVNTYAYWTGSWQGGRFLADDPEPQWLDYGWDWYAAVTWEDPDDPGQRYGMGWMNNWDYAARSVPSDASDGFNGMMSLVRQIRLHAHDGRYTLRSRPVDALERYASDRLEIPDALVRAGDGIDEGIRLPFCARSYRMDACISMKSAQGASIRIGESADGSRYTEFGVDSQGFYLDRTHAELEHFLFAPHLVTRSPLPPDAVDVRVTVLVDTQSVEVFVNDGECVHSDQVYFQQGDTGVSVHAQSGEACFGAISFSTIAV